ncbi:hypothetical protein D9R14_22635 [Xanthobacter tagetidis]|uniref:Uncharacterized protein n=1 Tax=Xanthobacter tagetidis TaxID=60216 RepID=A0A3L6ZSD0_9HYPH|nr:hypothetical protein D9R14_22635 [Xanthobacter tagetidis]
MTDECRDLMRGKSQLIDHVLCKWYGELIGLRFKLRENSLQFSDLFLGFIDLRGARRIYRSA